MWMENPWDCARDSNTHKHVYIGRKYFNDVFMINGYILFTKRQINMLYCKKIF